MCKEYNYIFNVQEALDHFHINLDEPLFMRLPLSVRTIQVPCRDNGTSQELEVQSINVGLTPIGVSIPITPINYNNCIQDCEYIDKETNFMIPDRHSYFTPLKLSEFDDYPLIMLYIKNLNKFYHFHNHHDHYYIIYKYNSKLFDNQQLSCIRNPIEEYMKQFPEDAFYIQKLDLVIRHTIILD